jgi:thioesterase domain-containing protein
MLETVQSSGTKRPFFFIHGLHGVMPLGSCFAGILGPDQPLYAVQASGIDGSAPVIDNVSEMAALYADEIEQVRPQGPVVVGGMCDGTWAAIETARELLRRGRDVGPVILADPPIIARSYAREDLDGNADQAEVSDGADGIETARTLKERMRQAGLLPEPAPPSSAALITELTPEVERQLYERVHHQLAAYAAHRYNSMPFDAWDPEQLHRATVAGVGALLALNRHLPRPFSGPAHMILSAGTRAIGFFHPDLPWQELLRGPRTVHVLPWDHVELFKSGREHVARAIKLMLAQGPTLEALVASRDRDTLARQA